jgi:hypothetical protein
MMKVLRVLPFMALAAAVLLGCSSVGQVGIMTSASANPGALLK